MSVPTNNLSAYKGEDFAPPFQVNAAVTGDITGWTIVATVKASDSDTSALLSVNCVVTDGPNRKFAPPFTAAQLASLTVGRYLYDIWRTDPGYHWVLSVGTFTILTERRVQAP